MTFSASRMRAESDAVPSARSSLKRRASGRERAWRLLLLIAGTAFHAPDALTQDGPPDAAQIADRFAISEVIAQYAYRWDAKDAEGFARLFTEDAVFEVSANGKLVPQGRLEGRPAILAYAKNAYAGRLAGKQSRHHMTSLVFLALSTERATTENLVLVTHQSKDDATPQNRVSGVYRNQWRKTADGWQIARRLLTLDGRRGQ